MKRTSRTARRNGSDRVVLCALLSGCVLAPPASPITAVQIELPSSQTWAQLTDQSDGEQYLREWVPRGFSGENAQWLISEQRLVPARPVSAKLFMEGMFERARSSCSNVLYNGPEALPDSGHTTYAGRIMCARRNGKDFGTFTELRVAADGPYVYVVVSERRTPPTPKAGVIQFEPSEGPERVKRFFAEMAASAEFVRSSVRICTAQAPGC
jgi:hypothetical protein